MVFFLPAGCVRDINFAKKFTKLLQFRQVFNCVLIEDKVM